MPNLLALARLWWTNSMGLDDLPRTPEPDALMDDAAVVEAFHSQGTALKPIYEFNARAVGALAPVGGRVVDLGSGSGHFLAWLGRGRPDLEIVGVELAPRMAERGNLFLKELGFLPRVRIVSGDMTDFRAVVPGRCDAVTAVFSLHHLPSEALAERALAQAAAARAAGAAFWLFDHARPRRRAAAALFPEAMTPDAAALFKRDSANSLSAAWRFSELSAMVEASLGAGGAALSRFIPFYQCHWRSDGSFPGRGLWRSPGLDAAAARDHQIFRLLFRGVPG